MNPSKHCSAIWTSLDDAKGMRLIIDPQCTYFSTPKTSRSSSLRMVTRRSGALNEPSFATFAMTLKNGPAKSGENTGSSSLRSLINRMGGGVRLWAPRGAREPSAS